jgi:hypothetical protein
MSSPCIVNDLGSIRTDVRYTFDSRHRQAGPTGPFSADTVAKVENRSAPKISRKLIFGHPSRCVAIQRH